ncbi:hypothetical protein [Paenibacillus campinasensis]|nr:hypothetical protein [Paenibacillus campinasensis]
MNALTTEQQRQEAAAIAQEIERQLDAEFELRTVDGILRHYGRKG